MDDGNEENPSDRSGRGPAALPDEVHDVLLSMMDGQYALPPSRSQRTNAETSAFRKRYNYQIEIVHNPLTGHKEKRLIHSKSGKIALKKTEVSATVRKAFVETKGDGAKKLFHIVGRDFVGLGGQHGIQRNLNTFPEKQQHRPLFKNRPPLKPVSASGVMTRNQTDIVDLRKVSIRKGDVTYRYVLSVMDVFSRFVFLPDKSGSTVARVLEKNYSVVGQPRILQTDQGKEFTARNVMKRFNCRMVHSSPYHPQSQGKVSTMYTAVQSCCLYLNIIYPTG